MKNYDLISTFICKGQNLGVNGNLFGGYMMSQIDEAAASYACMYCDSSKMVTLKVSELLFKSPVKVGEIVKIYINTKSLGRSSITLDVIVNKHNPVNAEEYSVTTAELVFVRIDEEGCSREIKKSVKEKFKIKQTLNLK